MHDLARFLDQLKVHAAVVVGPTLGAMVGYQKIDYGARPAGTLFDYRVRSGSVQLSRRLSERVKNSTMVRL